MSQHRASDTDPAASALRDDLLRKMTPGQKLYQMSRLCAVGRSLVLGRIKQEHGECSEEELLYWLAERTLGRETAEKYFCPDNERGQG